MASVTPKFDLELSNMSEIDLSSALRRFDSFDTGHSRTWSVDETGSTTRFAQQEDLNFRLRDLISNNLDLRLKRFSDIYTTQALPWIADETGFATTYWGRK
jgi:hypothetical protein